MFFLACKDESYFLFTSYLVILKKICDTIEFGTCLVICISKVYSNQCKIFSHAAIALHDLQPISGHS